MVNRYCVSTKFYKKKIHRNNINTQISGIKRHIGSNSSLSEEKLKIRLIVREKKQKKKKTKMSAENCSIIISLTYIWLLF